MTLIERLLGRPTLDVIERTERAITNAVGLARATDNAKAFADENFCDALRDLSEGVVPEDTADLASQLRRRGMHVDQLRSIVKDFKSFIRALAAGENYAEKESQLQDARVSAIADLDTANAGVITARSKLAYANHAVAEHGHIVREAGRLLAEHPEFAFAREAQDTEMHGVKQRVALIQAGARE